MHQLGAIRSGNHIVCVCLFSSPGLSSTCKYSTCSDLMLLWFININPGLSTSAKSFWLFISLQFNFTSVLFGQRLLSSSPFIEPVRYQEQESKAGTKAGIKLCLSATRVYVYFPPCSERPFISQMESALEVGKRVPFSTVESSSLAVAL